MDHITAGLADICGHDSPPHTSCYTVQTGNWQSDPAECVEGRRDIGVGAGEDIPSGEKMFVRTLLAELSQWNPYPKALRA